MYTDSQFSSNRFAAYFQESSNFNSGTAGNCDLEDLGQQQRTFDTAERLNLLLNKRRMIELYRVFIGWRVSIR